MDPCIRPVRQEEDDGGVPRTTRMLALQVSPTKLLAAAFLAALAWAEWRREAATTESRHWRLVAQQWTDYASNLRRQHRTLRRQHSELRTWIDDSILDPEIEKARMHRSPVDGELHGAVSRRVTLAGTANSSMAIRNHFDVPPSVVDYVFMWVDASNQHVQAVMEESLRKKVISHKPFFRRVRDDGTFEFALRSVLQARRLESVLRNVYIVTSGELPPWLLPWLGDVPSGVRSALYTTVPLRAPLQPLVDECQGVKTRRGWAPPRSLYLYPHRSLFPDAARELPTFNSNAILATLHRLPDISRWCVRSLHRGIIRAACGDPWCGGLW